MGKKTETFSGEYGGYGQMTREQQFVICTMQEAMPPDERDAFMADLREKMGRMEIEVTVNGFSMPFSAVVKFLNEQFSRAVNDAAGRLIVGKAQELIDQVSDLGETLRSVKREVESKADELFPGSVYREDR